MRRPASRTAAFYAVLFAGAALLYARSIGFSFVWDDEFFVVRNKAIQAWSFVPRYFTDASTYAGGTWAPMFRPMRNISYLLDFTAAGMDPRVFHAHNVLLHAVNACAVFWVLTLLVNAARAGEEAGAAWACFAGALFWTLHPVHTEAVAWVKSQDELLFTLFYLLAFGVYQSGVSGTGRLAVADGGRGGHEAEDDGQRQHPAHRLGAWRIAAVAGLFTLSVLSKEMALSFPLVLMLTHAYFGRRELRARTVALTALCGLVSVAYVAARHLVIGQTEQQGYLAGSFYAEMLTMARTAARYIVLAVSPSGLVADYQGFRVSHSILEIGVICSAAAVAGAVALALFLRRRVPLASFGIFWFGVTLLPVSNIVSTMQFLAERFLYLPLIGGAAVVTGLVLTMQAWLERRCALGELDSAGKSEKLRLATVLAGALFCVEAFSVSVRLPVWKDSDTLYERTFLDAPLSGRIAGNYAGVLARRGKREESMELFRRILRGDDARLRGASLSVVEQGYGLLLLSKGELDEGLSHTLEALRLDPNDANAVGNLGYYHGMRGNHEMAAKYFGKSAEMNPSDQSAWKNRGLALMKLGRIREAQEAYSRALALTDPASPEAAALRGKIGAAGAMNPTEH